MSDNGNGSGEIESKLAEWQGAGLLPAETAAAIRSYEAVHAPATVSPEHPRRRLNLAAIATYFGAFLILFAFTVFSSIQWVNWSDTTRLIYSTAVVIVLGAIGFFLHRRPPVLAGDLLVLVATVIVPIPIYCLLRVTGLWTIYHDTTEVIGKGGDVVNVVSVYHADVVRAWLILDLGTILITAAVLAIIRFPLVVVPLAVWLWFLGLDLARLITENGERASNDTPTLLPRIFVGLLLIGVGIMLDRRTERDISFWLYLTGNFGVLIPFTVLAIRYEMPIGLFVFPLFYLMIVVLAVLLQRNLFLVFGAIGLYGYVTYLAFDIFPGARGFSLALAVVGLLIVLSARWFQRSGRDRMEKLFRVRALAKPGSPI